MSYYKHRLEKDSAAIRTQVTELGRTVELALRNSVTALLKRDDVLAYQTIIEDHPVNRATEAIDHECHIFVARHLPSAGHLRFISSAMKLNLLLERMGDYAATIARESVQLTSPLAGTFRAEVEAMAADAIQMFDRALTAYMNQDESLARETTKFAKQVDRDYMRAFKFLTNQPANPADTANLFACLTIISRLERVSDQAKNICEETLFSLTGETKKRRPMRILFLEHNNDCYAPMAVAIGQRFFSDRGIFVSAGSAPAPAVRSDIATFLADHGLGIDENPPRSIEWSDDDWNDFDIIIGINQSYRDDVPSVPFLTAAFEWWIPESENEENRLTEAYRFLHAHVEDLIVTLRGKPSATA